MAMKHFGCCQSVFLRSLFQTFIPYQFTLVPFFSLPLCPYEHTIKIQQDNIFHCKRDMSHTADKCLLLHIISIVIEVLPGVYAMSHVYNIVPLTGLLFCLRLTINKDLKNS